MEKIESLAVREITGMRNLKYETLAFAVKEYVGAFSVCVNEVYDTDVAL